MTKSHLAARPVFHRLRDSIDAHLTVVFAALAVSREAQARQPVHQHDHQTAATPAHHDVPPRIRDEAQLTQVKRRAVLPPVLGAGRACRGVWAA